MSQENGSISPQIFHKDIPYSDIQLGDVVGRGAYGTVHKAMWNGLQVAVKVMEGDDAAKSLNKEVHQLSKLRHENIIRLYGVSSQKPKVCLIMEYAENGSLYDLLHPKEDTKPYDYTIGHMMSWALQCARAMEYLHGLTPIPIVHRDLKPPNMLLKERGTVLKICDFGTARLQDTSHMTVNKGSAAWMAPEVFAGPSYTEKCDIFSFGILLWEMITRQKPFEDIGVNNFRILWAVHNDTRPPLVRGIPKIFEQLMVFAWHKDPTVRPPFSAIVLFLEKASKFVTGCNAPLVMPISSRTDSSSESCSESYSESSSYGDTTKEQHSSLGSSGKVSISGKDKVMYKVSSPEQGPPSSEYDLLPIRPPSIEDPIVDCTDPSRKSPFSPVFTPEKEGPYAGHTEAAKQGSAAPEAPSFNFPPYNDKYSDANSINDPATKPSNIDGSSPTHANLFQKQNNKDEGMSPPAYPGGDFVVRPRQRPLHDNSPIHTSSPRAPPPQFPFQSPPYFPPRTSPGHRLRTPSPGSAPPLYDPQTWNVPGFHPIIPENSPVRGMCDRFGEMNVNDFVGNDIVFAPNAAAPGHPSGRSSLEVSRSGSSRSSGTSSPLNSAFSSPSVSELSLENRPVRVLPPRHAIPQSAPDNQYEKNLWHLVDPEIMPVTPIQNSQESLDIYEEHSKLIYEYVSLQKDFEYLLQRKRAITQQLEAERREQQRSSIYLEEYLNLLEERQSLSAFLGTLRHELQQANSLRGSGENLL